MLSMVKDPVFVRKLRKLENFTEYDFITIDNIIWGACIAIIEEG